MKMFYKIVILAVSVLSSTISIAKTSEWALSDAGVDYGLTQLGASYRLEGHLLNILIDQDKVLEHLDEQINDGAYNSNYTKNYYISHPVLYFFNSALNASIFIIPRVYQDHPNLNYINVKVRIKYENLLGNDTVGSLLSFEMSRGLNNQINWTRFLPANAGYVYPNFRFSNWALAELTKEHI